MSQAAASPDVVRDIERVDPGIGGREGPLRAAGVICKGETP